ncbi:hypothetical protein V6N13_013088 [Hibiscus sabdariffa]
MAGSTCELRSDAGIKPLSAASGDAESPRKILVAGTSVVHCFYAFSSASIAIRITMTTKVKKEQDLLNMFVQVQLAPHLPSFSAGAPTTAALM